MKKKNRTSVSIKDIARKCSLSAMTVSRALRNAYGIKSETRESILKVARELGYIPNRIAANLAQRKTTTIGVVIPDIAHSIFPEIVKNIELQLDAQGYRLFLCCSYDQPAKEYQEIQALLERRVDGIIIAPATTDESREAMEKILAQNCPLVFIDRIVPGINVDSVTVDDYDGAFQAVTHLIEQGYQKIAHIAGPKNVWTAKERMRGYKEALKKLLPEAQKKIIVYGGLTLSDGELAMERLLRAEILPDAIFCVNDPVAIGAFKVLQREGIRVPESIGLVGFSNTLESEIMHIPLTTVHQDATLLGKQAAQLLLARTKKDLTNSEPIKQVLKTHLIIRKSSMPKIY